MSRRDRAQVARLLCELTNLDATTHAVVIVIMSAWDEFRCAGGSAGKLEIGHFISRRWRGSKILSRMVNRILQVMLTAVVEQLHHANGRMLCNKCVEEIISAKQRMLAIGNQ